MQDTKNKFFYFIAFHRQCHFHPNPSHPISFISQQFTLKPEALHYHPVIYSTAYNEHNTATIYYQTDRSMGKGLLLGFF